MGEIVKFFTIACFNYEFMYGKLMIKPFLDTWGGHMDSTHICTCVCS